MIDQLKVVALIPARGGSKEILHNNISLLNNKPLIYYTICESKKSHYIDRVIVSTDSLEIARKYGDETPFVRRDNLAEDTTKTEAVITHPLEYLSKESDQIDILVLLQPTSPLRTAQEIDNALGQYISSGCKNLASISRVPYSHAVI